MAERRKTLVLTGFGPFGKFERNPSWDVVESLDGEVFSCAGTPGIKSVWPSVGQISLKAVAKQLPVDYSTCAVCHPARAARPCVRLGVLLPHCQWHWQGCSGPGDNGVRLRCVVVRAGKVQSLLEPMFDSDNIGLIVNVGVGLAGQIKLEQRARNGTYEKRDNTDAAPVTGKVRNPITCRPLRWSKPYASN